MDKLAVGNLGEQLAEQYLIKKGFKIIERNYETPRWGETVVAVQDHEEQLMDFCSNRTGGAIRMLAEFEPESGAWQRSLRSYLDHPDTDMGFLRADVRALTAKWSPEPGFYGYLIGHEDDPLYPEALRRVLEENMKQWDETAETPIPKELRQSAEEIAQRAKIRPFLVRSYIQQIRNVTPYEFEYAFQCLLDADKNLKSSYQNPRLIMELLIYRLCRLSENA